MAKIPVPGLEINQAKMDKIAAAFAGMNGIQPGDTALDPMIRATKQFWNQAYKRYNDQTAIAAVPPTPDLNLDN